MITKLPYLMLHGVCQAEVLAGGDGPKTELEGALRVSL
jgi:hypothetical protein